MRPRHLAVLAVAALTSSACSSGSSGIIDEQALAATTIAGATDATTDPTDPTTTPPTTRPDPTTPATSPPASSAPELDPWTVVTDLGMVQGTDAAEPGVRSFLTIPYAEPPVGALRFAPPVTREPWPDVLVATTPGAACPQRAEGAAAQFTVMPAWDDDCLTLSVWTPETTAELPVMVWFHGGSLVNGSAHQPYYIGDRLAARGVVVVGVNYRLGPLGFLDGNWGLLDQAEALDWVQRNIAAFGGDPARVTIFGESAGGFSVCGHLGADPGPVFAQALIQSGGGCARLQPPADTAAATATYLGQIDCSDLDCARSLTADELLAAPFNATLVADDRLAKSAFERAVEGDLPNRPIVTGFNTDEATLFTIGLSVATDEDLIDLIEPFTDDVEALLSLYPRDQFEDLLARYRAIWTDAVFACNALAFASVTPNSYVYEFSYVSPSTPFDLGATHGAELAYVFGHPEGLTLLDAEFDPADAAVAERIQSAWVDFATTGAPPWPRFDGPMGQVLDIGVDDVIVDVVRSGRCEAAFALRRR